jgi:hypothetical protein
MEKRICLGCKKLFEARNGNQKYCTRFCYPTTYQPTKRTCRVCRVEFIGKTRECSINCYLIFEQNRKQRLRKAYKKTLQKALCQWCHGSFLQRVGVQHIFCTLECGAEFRRMQKQICKEFIGKPRFEELDRLQKEGKNYALPQ